MTRIIEVGSKILCPRRLEVAHRWRGEFDAIPAGDAALVKVWLASKLRVDSFRKTERLIYERTLKRDLDYAKLWHRPAPPSTAAVAFAAALCVVAFLLPVYYLVLTGTRLGPKRSWSFLVNFGFEFAITYFLVAPLTILFNKVFLPSLLDERLKKAALEDAKDAKHFAAYPYATPLAQTPLDLLVDLEPRLQAHVASAKSAKPSARGASRLALAGPGGAAVVAAGPSLEVLEEIYNETHWRPTWASYVALGLLGYFLELPDTLQDILMEEVLLFIPATSFFVSKGIFSATGRVRRGTYSNGGFLLVFTLLFGNLSALALTAFLSRAQERNAKHHHARREKAHERASTSVWKSTTGLGRPDQTLKFSRSVNSKSIRLIFGRIDCSRRVIEAQPKRLRRNCRIRSH